MSGPSATDLAERALLAAVLFDSFLFAEAQALGAEAFSNGHRGAVWAAFHDLNGRRRVINLVTVVEALRKSGRAAPPGVSGWAEACSALLDEDFLPERESVREYARVIREAALRRRSLQRVHA